MYKFTQIFDPVKELLILLEDVQYDIAYDIYEWLWSLANNLEKKDTLYKKLVLVLHPDISKNKKYEKIFSYINTIKDGIPAQSVKQKLQTIKTFETGIDVFSELKKLFDPDESETKSKINSGISNKSFDQLYADYIARRRKRRQEEERGEMNIPTYIRRRREKNQQKSSTPYTPPMDSGPSRWKRQRDIIDS